MWQYNWCLGRDGGSLEVGDIKTPVQQSHPWSGAPPSPFQELNATFTLAPRTFKPKMEDDNQGEGQVVREVIAS